ncbi:MAG TPA: DCC1-like thiol-disulfide oxidoreductase family protein [Steroidobacteraceae bacterium]
MNGAARPPFSYRADPDVPKFPDDKPLVVFDGDCVLCSKGAQSLIKRDRRAVFRMTVAQSALGQALYRHYGLNNLDFDTYLLIDSGVAYFKSDATVRVLARLPFPYSIAGLLRCVPRRGRDIVYDFIARRRIRWFGARESCFVPSPADAGRFLS